MDYIYKDRRVEAIQWTGYNKEAVRNFLGMAWVGMTRKYKCWRGYPMIKFRGPEGRRDSFVRRGDYIVYVGGEFIDASTDCFHEPSRLRIVT